MGNNGSGSSSTTPPCAACKLLKRRCDQNCPLSPYFSPQETHKFKLVHAVYGASNFSKILMEVPESQRAEAANNLVYEASLRERDPVHGSMSVICALQRDIHSAQAELDAVRAQISKCRDEADVVPPLSNGSLQPNTAASMDAPALSPPSAPPHLHPSSPSSSSSSSSSTLSRLSQPSQK